jgi:outer membrane protein assembly factor BamB
MSNLIKNFFTDHRESTPINEQLWKRIAWSAGIFSFIICILLIANFAQIKKVDPVNMTVINSLVERLSENPSDTKLRDEIRILDLLARKAYFTNRWQIKTGGFLLLVSVLVLIISLQVISLSRKKDPMLSEADDDNQILTGKNARKWIALSGAAFLILSLALAWLSQKEIQSTFEKASVISVAADSAILANTTEDSSAQTATDSTSDSTQSTQTPTQTQTPPAANPLAVAPPVAPLPSSKSDNFPNFRGPGGLGIITQRNIPVSWDGATGQNVLWKTPVPLAGYNSPVIWGNKLFLTGSDGTKREIYCFDINNGKILWTTPVQNIQGSPTQVPKVANETGHSAPTAATNGKAVFAIFSNGDLIALDMDGKKIWEKNLGMPQNHYGHSSSLMIWKELLIIQWDQRVEPKILAVSVKTGETKWSTSRPVKISWASPVLVNTGKRTELMLAAEPYVASYNPDTGEELWKIDCISGEVGPSLAYANGIVFSVNDYSKLAAVRVGDQPELLWETDEYLSDIPSPVATDKYLFLATSFGVTVCYDAQNGTKYWEKEFINSIYSSPVIVEDKVYLLDRTGIMHIFKADKELTILSEPKLGEKSACTPAFTEGRIYIRGEKNLYCIGKL